jgi:DNA-binding NarL/FixJ family response regulator
MPRLTRTEQRVATLVAEGRTNPGVAKALGLSPKAVEAHLSEIYRKLGQRTRRELEAVLVAALRDETPSRSTHNSPKSRGGSHAKTGADSDC